MLFPDVSLSSVWINFQRQHRPHWIIHVVHIQLCTQLHTNRIQPRRLRARNPRLVRT